MFVREKDDAMMKDKRSGLAWPLVALTALVVSAAGADEKKAEKEKASLWMEKKLEFTQQILAGLTKGDFEAISSNAGKMQVVTYLEAWDRGKNPEYRRQLKY